MCTRYEIGRYRYQLGLLTSDRRGKMIRPGEITLALISKLTLVKSAQNVE